MKGGEELTDGEEQRKSKSQEASYCEFLEGQF